MARAVLQVGQSLGQAQHLLHSPAGQWKCWEQLELPDQIPSKMLYFAARTLPSLPCKGLVQDGIRRPQRTVLPLLQGWVLPPAQWKNTEHQCPRGCNLNCGFQPVPRSSSSPACCYLHGLTEKHHLISCNLLVLSQTLLESVPPLKQLWAVLGGEVALLLLCCGSAPPNALCPCAIEAICHCYSPVCLLSPDSLFPRPSPRSEWWLLPTWAPAVLLVSCPNVSWQIKAQKWQK